MQEYFILNVKRTFLFVCVCLALLWGCGDKSEPPQKPQVVRKKIQVESKAAEKKQDKVMQNSPSDMVENAKKSSVESVSQPLRKSLDADKSIAPEIKEKKTEPLKPLQMIFPTSENSTENSLTNQFASNDPPLYNPEGKIDPFMPLFKKESPEEKKAADKPKKKRRIPRTPLEKLDLSQLKLVGIIMATDNQKALVEESSGKGYIVTKGTYIGRNGGRVTNIQSDRIIIKEEVVDVLGKSKIKKTELKLQKPFGEN
jgi:type IV pilus assembly protein PilP